MTKRWFGALAAVWLVGACAGTSASNTSGTTAATRPENPGGEHHGEHQGEHHHEMPAPMVAFHDVLRPLWHSDPGAEREARTCAEAANLRARATPVAEMAVPEGARSREQGWRTSAAQLVATSDALVAACGATPRGNVAGSLEAVHTAFHGLLDHMGQGHH